MGRTMIGDWLDEAKTFRFEEKDVELSEALILDSVRPKFILGRNVYAERVVDKIDFSGFLDDFSEQESYLGLPRFVLEDLPSNAIVLVVSGGRPLTVCKKMEDMDIDHVHIFHFMRLSGLDLGEIVFLEGFEQDIYSNQDKYESVYNWLADSESREIFRKLTMFKLTYSLSFLEGFTYREDEQYFESFLDLAAGEVFFDIGSFDGFTSEEFIKKCRGYKEVHIFEPLEENLSVIRSRLEGFSDVVYWPFGVSNKSEAVGFSAAGSGSRVVEGGNILVDVVALDELDLPNPTFLKMDIEGAEMSAVEGAKNTIINSKPKLALAAYHRVQDIWQLPFAIKEMVPSYRLTLRHYTESIYESVLFFT